MSAARLEELLAVLDVEERVHRELRQILAGERERMLDLDTTGLYELVRGKEALAEEGRLAAEARVEAAKRLARSIGIQEETLTLSRLCEELGDEGALLRDAQSRLLALVTATQELAEANRLLGGDRLSHVQTTLHLLGRLLPEARSEDAGGGGRLVRTRA